ncbi:MAG: hypothetical protein JW936_06850 [Sedimentisphaerales bacterium]|nr:hypothetical protein [Sedimentisphaerales bacterium]
MKPRRIHEHTLRVLEFSAIRQILSRYAASELGQNAALQLHPSLDPHWITQRIAETTQMRNLLQQQTRLPISGLRDITTILGKCDAGTTLEPAQLLEIASTLETANNLREFLTAITAYPALNKLAQQLQDFTPIVSEINRCVENEQRLADHASEKLHNLRQTIEKLEEQIRRQLKRILSDPNLQDAIENENILIRNNRPVIAVKKNYRAWMPGLVIDRSAGGATLYVEPQALVQVSNELEEALYEQSQEVSRILWELTRLVTQERQAIRSTVQALGHIDLTYAKARFSIAQNHNPPTLSQHNRVVMHDARHPLLLEFAFQKQKQQEKTQPHDPFNAVVPISLTLGQDYDLLLLTGPNTGGKTVTLKTLGIAALMHQSGMHIAAAPNAELPLFQRIYADIGDEQSIEQSLSTFSAHMAQIVELLQGAHHDSLVLLDELGAGTDPTEGAALATAILSQLLKKRAKIIATTHLGNLKRFAFAQDRASNASVDFNPQTLQPTYRLRIGEPGTSNALAIAKRLNMPPDVIKHAKSLLGTDVVAEGEIMQQAQAIRTVAQKEQQIAQDLRRQAQQIRDNAQKELQRINQERRSIQAEADAQIDRAYEQVRHQTRQLLHRMNNAPQTWLQQVEQFAQTIENLTSSTTLAQRRANVVAHARPGDYVFVRRLQRTAMVVSIHKKQKTMTVSIDNKHIDVPFEQISEPPT